MVTQEIRNYGVVVVGSDGVVKPRGYKVSLPHHALPEVVNPYLQNLTLQSGGMDGVIGRQFYARPDLERSHFGEDQDPLLETEYEVAPGLIYKYQGEVDENGYVTKPGRGLFTITTKCASFCRFCTRGDIVGMKKGEKEEGERALSHSPNLSREQIDESLEFIRNTPDLREVILSGGDPLTVKPDVLKYVLGRLGQFQNEGLVDIVRIGTRLPVHNPYAVTADMYEAISQLKNPYLMVHINHSYEMTEQTLEVLDNFRKKSGATIKSQTVLLRGVNVFDDIDDFVRCNPTVSLHKSKDDLNDEEIFYYTKVVTLEKMFHTMVREGINPYYVFQNDPVYWAKHFTVPLEIAINLWQRLRPRLSGLAATARFVIDVPHGHGKVVVPEGGSWNFDGRRYRDFQGNEFEVDEDY